MKNLFRFFVRNKISKAAKYFLATLFFIILTIPTLDNFFHFSPVKELFEKRLPSENPEFAFDKNYPKKFDEFYNDNYGFRKTLIAMHSKIMDDVFDESPSERAVRGKDDWLYFNNYNSLIDVEGRVIYDPALLEKGINSLIANWQKLKAENIDYVLIIAADKASIYPEFLPDYIKPKTPTKLDQFLAKLKEKSPDFPVIDLRKSLLKAKDKEQIYYKTDTHWNRIGAHYGYLEIIDFLANKYPNLKNLKPKPRDKFKIQNNGKRVGDISQIMNLENLKDDELEMIPIVPFGYSKISTSDEMKKQFHKPNFFVNQDRNLPILFSYKDSFMDALDYFLSDHFSKSYYVNEFSCDINIETIKPFNPNVLIHEMWEGRMEEVFKSCK